MPDRTRTADSWRPALWTAAIAVAAPVLTGIVLIAAATQDLGWGAVRGGVRAWLVAVGSGLSLGDTSLTLVPLGGVIVAGSFAALAAARVADEQTPDAVVFGAVAGVAAGALAAVLSAATSTGSVGTSFVRAAFGAFLVVGVSAALTVAALHRGSRRLPSRLEPLLPAVVAGLRAAALQVAFAAVLVLALGALHVRRAGHLWAALDPGGTGGVLLGLLSILALPTIVGWASAVLIGPGFALGTDTHVGITGVDVAAVPAFPPLATIPDPGPFPAVVVGLMVVPALIAGYAGWRWIAATGDEGWWTRIGLGALAGATAGLVVGAVAATGHGAVGPGLLSDVGPPVVSTLGLAIVSWALAGAIGAALGHYRGLRAHSQ